MSAAGGVRPVHTLPRAEWSSSITRHVNTCLDTQCENTYYVRMTASLQNEIRQTRPFSSLREEALLSLWRTSAALQDGLERVLRNHGLSAAQYNVLRILRGAGPDGLCRNEIRDRLVARMPDVTRLLDRLETMCLVRRKRSTDDRRQVSTYLTESGATLLAGLDAPVAAEHERQLRHLGDDQLRTFISLCALAREGS